MPKRTLLLSLAIATLAAVAPWAKADPLIFVDPADYIPPPPYSGNTTFIVPVEISGAVNLTFWQFDLLYDPSDVQIVTNCDPFTDIYCNFDEAGITEGPFFGSLSPFNVFNPGFIVLDAGLAQIGQLIAVNDSFGGDTPPSGDGILAYVEFVTTENGNGESPITVTNTSTASAAPEPTTLILLASGLVLLGGRRPLRRERRN
jgi:hypothetical protein